MFCRKIYFEDGTVMENKFLYTTSALPGFVEVHAQGTRDPECHLNTRFITKVIEDYAPGDD